MKFQSERLPTPTSNWRSSEKGKLDRYSQDVPAKPGFSQASSVKPKKPFPFNKRPFPKHKKDLRELDHSEVRPLAVSTKSTPPCNDPLDDPVLEDDALTGVFPYPGE